MKEFLLPDNLTLIQQIGLYALYATASIQFVFIWIIFTRFAFFTKEPNISSKTESEPVSVIIVAKNEYHNLKVNLPKVLEQDYPNFEVILVNHASTDDTEYLARELCQKYSNLKYLVVQDDINFFNGKKFPLSIGIKSANNELLLLTDADCYPSSKNWIAEMQCNFNAKKDIVLGYGAYEYRKGFLNKIIRYDSMRVGQLYLSLARIGIPYMGVGRNLVYRRSLFFKEKGFQSHYSIPSGDDDLFINKVANFKNTNVAVGNNCKTISTSKTKYGDWYYQKKRHLSTGKHYRVSHLFVLGLWDLSTLIFFSLTAIFLIYQFLLPLILSILGLRLISQLIVTKKTMLLLGEKKLLLFSPILELIVLIANPIVSIINIFAKKRKW